MGRRPHPLPHGGLLPRPTSPLRRPDGRRPNPSATAGTTTRTTASPRRRSKTTLELPKPYQPREDDIDEQVRRDLDRMDLDTVGVDGPRLFAVTPAEAKRALDRFIEHRLPDLRPLRGRHHGPGLGDVALAAVGAAEPRCAAPARRRRSRRTGLPGERQLRWPPSRDSSARSSAGASTCGTCTGISARTTPSNNELAARTPLPDWWTRPRRRRRHRRMPAARARRVCATADGPITSSG